MSSWPAAVRTRASWDLEQAAWFGATILGTIALTIAAVVVNPVVVAAPMVLLLGYVAIGRPRFTLTAWVVLVCVTPHWFNVRFQATFPPASLLALLFVPALLSGDRVRWRPADLVAAGIIGLYITAFLVSHVPKPYFFAALIQGALPYLLARKLVPKAGETWFSQLMAALLAFVAVWAIFEYAANWHPFVGLDPGSSEANWANIQYRGGHARSEAAFGHAIALGAVLAMGVPFALATPWRGRTKVLVIALLALGILASGSRGPAIALGLALLLGVVFYRGAAFRRGQRIALGAIGLVGGALMISALSSRLSASATEASDSANYRGQLYDFVFKDIHPLSVADHFTFLPTGGFEWRTVFHSIDSTFVSTALVWGWLPVAVLFAGLLVLIVKVFRGRGNAAEVALLAQIPVLATVALITQYYALIWFLGGAAVALSATAREAPPQASRS